MDQKTTNLMFAVIRSVVLRRPLSEEERKLFSMDMLKELMSIAKKHDVAHLVAYGLSQSGLVPKGEAGLDRAVLQAAYRYEQLNYEYGRLCEALEEGEIPFMPLKGSVLRSHYPEPWMRTSCDVDVLIHESDLPLAVKHLCDRLGYTLGPRTPHDVSLYSEGGMHIELHFDLMEDGWANSAGTILSRVWEVSYLREGCKAWYEMPDDLFYYFHIAHMAKHVETGGCGIRPLIDLWILDHLEGIDRDRRDALLKEGNLLTFAEAARRLSRVWMGGEPMDEVSWQMENYILRGGVYGTSENFVLLQQQKKGGRVRFVFARVFLSYELLKSQYPILKKHRWLTPVMEVRRWFRILFCGRFKHSVNELKQNGRVELSEAEATRIFLDHIGL